MTDIKLLKIDKGLKELPATLVSLERVTNIN
ncbi:hypothetical protein SDC9_183736 [bioreactor metagenome]|uniref:Uncharacterized protein n=1 Tax=bioreactor metagenome TaxID=1076179 RepID=A0A645HB24_9ZZZZ